MTSCDLISPSEIGFMKTKRTSDHIYVLKAIIEEVKAKRVPVFACFVDLRKAFDTVWRDSLYYKLIFDHKISTKFVSIIRSLYDNISSCVKLSGGVSGPIDIFIGLRQGIF